MSQVSLYPHFIQELLPHIHDPQVLRNLSLLHKKIHEDIVRLISPDTALKLLTQALHFKKFQTVRFLINQYRFDPTIEALVMDWALRYQLLDLQRDLGQRDVHPIRDITRFTELILKTASLDVLKIALEAGANPNPLLIGSVYDDRPELVSFFLEHGADVHHQNDSALVSAAEEGYINIVKILLNYGANVHARNDEALIHAILNNDQPMVELLLKAGANPHAQNDEPLRLAQNKANILRLLSQK